MTPKSQERQSGAEIRSFPLRCRVPAKQASYGYFHTRSAEFIIIIISSSSSSSNNNNAFTVPLLQTEHRWITHSSPVLVIYAAPTFWNACSQHYKINSYSKTIPNNHSISSKSTVYSVYPASDVPLDYALAIGGILDTTVFYLGGRNDDCFSRQAMRFRRMAGSEVVRDGRRCVRRRRCRRRRRARVCGRTECAGGQIASTAGGERVDRSAGEESAVVTVEDE